MLEMGQKGEISLQATGSKTAKIQVAQELTQKELVFSVK